MSIKQKQKLFLDTVIAINGKLTAGEAGAMWRIMYR